MTQHTQHQISKPTAPNEPQPDPRADDRVRRLREPGGTYPATAGTALLRVRPRTFRQVQVDAGGTRLRLRALHVMGHGSARLARAAGTREKAIRALVNGDARTVSIRLRDTVTTVYEHWWDKRAPERTRAERAAARTARRRAIAGNWCAAAALDDDKLDTPGYKPSHGWHPATGTGVAADIHRPPVQTQARRGA